MDTDSGLDEVVEFEIDSFQTPIMLLVCELCRKYWAADFEEAKCTCDDYIYPPLDPTSGRVVDVLAYYPFFMDGIPKKLFWGFCIVPYYFYLMQVCPKWIDFP